LVTSIHVPDENTTPAITINAPMGGVLLDLNGFAIGGPNNLAPAIHIPPGHPDVTIQNGFILNVRGVPAILAESVRVTIRDITFSGCDQPIRAASQSMIEGCLAWNGGGGNSPQGVLVAAGNSVLRDCAIGDFRVGSASAPYPAAMEVGANSRAEGVVLRNLVHVSSTSYALRASDNSILDRVILLPHSGNMRPTDGTARLRAFVAHGDSTQPLVGHTASESVLWGTSKFSSFTQVNHSITYGGTSTAPGFQDCEQLHGVLAAGHNHINTLEAAFNKQSGPWTLRRSLSHQNHWRDVRLLTSHKSVSDNLIAASGAADIFHNASDPSNRHHLVRDNHLVGAGAEISATQSSVEGNSLALTSGTNASVPGTPLVNPGSAFVTDQSRANFVIHEP